MHNLGRNANFPKKAVEYTLVSIAFSLIFFILFNPALKAQFSLVDDHTILQIAASDQPLPKIIEAAFTSNLEAGRFKPGHVLSPFIGLALFGTNPASWHLAIIGAGLLTGLFLYAAMRNLGMDILSSLFLILLFTVTGSQNSIWYRLLTGETWGILLTTVAVWAVSKAVRYNCVGRWDTIFIGVTCLAASFKESFVLTIPALLLLRWLLQMHVQKQTWRQSLILLRWPLTAGTVIFIIYMSVMAFLLVSRPEGHGATAASLSMQSVDPRRWYQNLALIDRLIIIYDTLMLLILIFVFRRSKEDTAAAAILAMAGVVLIWVVPQLVLYSQSMEGHYRVPAVIGWLVPAVVAFCISWQQRRWVLWSLTLIFFVALILSGLTPTIGRFSYYTAETLALNRMKNYLVHRVDEDQAVVVALDPVAHYEGAFSLRSHLRFSGLDSPVYLLPVYHEDTHRRHPLAEHLITVSFAGFTDLELLNANDVGAIIGLDPPNAITQIPSWFSPAEWEWVEFSMPYYGFSWQKLSPVEQGHYDYVVLVQKSDD